MPRVWISWAASAAAVREGPVRPRQIPVGGLVIGSGDTSGQAVLCAPESLVVNPGGGAIVIGPGDGGLVETAIPEPTGALLFAAGALILCGRRRRRA